MSILVVQFSGTSSCVDFSYAKKDIILFHKIYANRSVQFDCIPSIGKASNHDVCMAYRADSIHPFIYPRRSVRTLAIMFFTVLFMSIMYAGSIRGIVHAKGTNEILIGTNLMLKKTELGTVSDLNGFFKIEKIPKGEYSLHVRMMGYKKMEIDHIKIDSDTSVVIEDVFLEEKPVDMAEIVVQGRANQELEASGVRSEFEANNIINVVTAQTIERSTDKTAAEVLQRISGLSLIKNNGEGRYVIMRGLEQQYNNTLIDGIKIPSPESKDRFIPLDIFPSALFERIDVTKSLTPDLPGDAIGGTADLIFRSAPESFVFNISAATGYSSSLIHNTISIFDPSTVPELDPERLHGRASDADPTTLLGPIYKTSASDFTINNLKFINRPAPPDGLYSLVIGNRFFDKQLGIIAAGSYQDTYNVTQTEVYTLDENVNNNYAPYDATRDDRTYGSHKMRSGATVKADFIMAIDQQLSATFIYLNQVEDLTMHGLSATVFGSKGGSPFTYTNESALRKQTIANYTLSGEHFTSQPISLRWMANYSDAIQDRPDDADYTLLGKYDKHGNPPTTFGFGNIYHSWRKNDDKQYLGKADISWKLTENGMHTIQSGASYIDLKRVNFQNDYQLNASIQKNGSTQTFTELDSMQVTPFGYYGTAVFGYQNYKAHEGLWSGYVEYVLNTNSIQILTGVRWEQATDQYWTAAPIKQGPITGPTSDTAKFIDLLPSMHIRYAIDPENIFRLSISGTMSRPSYFDLVPAQDRGDVNTTQGNPNLKPAHATNVDLQYEYVTSTTNQISIGAYAKRITDPIEDEISGAITSTRSKGNGNPADVYGVEESSIVHFGNFGISENFTYVYSRITDEVYSVAIDNQGNNVTTYFQRTRPLQSQSPVLANATLLYDNSQWGTGLRISYNYTGRRLSAVNNEDGHDIYEDAVGDMDCAADQEILPGLKVSIKLSNLLNSKIVEEVPTGKMMVHPTLFVQQDTNKLRGTVGISFRL